MSVRGLGSKSFNDGLSSNGKIRNGTANGISNTTDDTQETCDFIEGLVEKCTEDPSHVFHPEVIERLAHLKQENRLAFESLRVRLKKVGCRLAALEDVVDDASGDKERDPTQLDVLLSLADDIDELFHTADGTAYAGMVVQGHRETWAVKSDGFCHWLQQRFFEKTNRALHSETLRVGLQNFEARSRFQGQEHEVFLRVGSLDEKTYIDLCNNRWQAIEVDANGWRVVDSPPVRFRRTPGMKPLPAPVRGGDINTLRKFLNVPSDEDFVLIVCWILHSLRSRGDIPPMVLNGEMGSSKSTLSTILKSLVDPSASSIRSLPKRDADLFISASNSYVLAFDNVSGLSISISDTLCMLSTGGSHVARELFTNQKEQTFSATIPLILNGIEEFVHRSDLADRSLFITLESIPEDERRAKTEFWKSFETEHSGIFGALLDGMVEGLRNINEARSRLPYLPRMSDFALFSVACEGAYWEQGTFWKAYSDNRDDAVEHLVEADPFAQAICAFIVRQPEKSWEGTATDLSKALAYVADGRITKSKNWLSSPVACGGHLRRVAPVLRKMGIEIEFIRKGQSGRRIIRIRTSSNFVDLEASDIGVSAVSLSVTPVIPSENGRFSSSTDSTDSWTPSLTDSRKNVPPIVSRHLNIPENGNCDRNENIAGITPRTIYHGDNLSLLREIGTETVDLIATDPPFNTGREQQGSSGASFPDRWNWQNVREEWLKDIERIEGLSDYIAYVQKMNSSMAAYLCFMAVRLMEMRRILKPTGSVYLHCDPTASYHLREVMNLIFGRENFRNEITWSYNKWTNAASYFQRNHDVILWYGKSNKVVFNPFYIVTEDKKEKLKIGYVTNTVGKEKIKQLIVYDREKAEHKIKEGKYDKIVYAEDKLGTLIPDVWTDINILNSQTKERTGYPTQKPVELYKRIIEASSNPSDVVLDPFCGSGTTLIAAEHLGRQWIGIDTSEDACQTVQRRFRELSSPADNQTTPLPSKRNLPAIIPYQPGDSINVQPRTIYHGDNLSLLREIGTETVDLIATDPPFNTGREQQGSSGASFPDRWNWQNVREEWLKDIERIEGLSDYIAYVQKTNSSMAAYLCFMAVRLIEVRRVLKDTGSIYLHCDPTASYHLREVMNLIFGKENFRNEITWCYAPSGNPPKKSFSKKHDVILFYTKSDKSTFHPQYRQMTEKTRKSYNNIDEDGRRYYKRHGANRTYLDESKGRPVPSWWDDIPSFASASNSKERTGYPTQKPTELYKRIIEASSNPGDVVLDPFCGSGTTLIAAETLGRQWIGIDSSKDACQTAQRRFGGISSSADNQTLPLPSKRNLPAIIPYQLGSSINVQPRTIYRGDNLSLLRHMETETVDLIATDPPFNTGREWQGPAGSFDDRFKSTEEYVEWMRERVIEMHRVLKPTGSIYLHCDPTASHYIKGLMDKIFGMGNFRNEIIWKRYRGKRATKNPRCFARVTDTILFYTKTDEYIFNLQFSPLRDDYVKSVYKHNDNDGKGPYRFGGRIRDRKYYLSNSRGVPAVSLWDDIYELNGIADEDTGYPTQKPVQLYKRIIEASSNPGDMVLDPFCGSGTTLIAAEQLERRWIGIDSSRDACDVAQRRFGELSSPADNRTLPFPAKRSLPSVISCQPEDSINVHPRAIYHGDNLSLLSQMGTETIDLIATDPPFNTGREREGLAGSFDDRFKNTEEYIKWMRERVIEMHRVLKPTGSIYLHCDPTASHHLKVMMDEVFGRDNFRNEIVWHYSKWTNAASHFQRNHDIILYYGASSKVVFNRPLGEMTDNQVDLRKRGYNLGSNNGKMIARVYDKEKCADKIEKWKTEGREIYYVKDIGGIPVPDVWSISILSGSSKERVNYPTQKPVTLYKRIIEASSNPGDVVLDPFCGSGTTLIAAETLGRKWIGIDSSKDACEVAQRRFGNIQEPNLNDTADLPALETHDIPETHTNNRWKWLDKVKRTFSRIGR